MKSGNLVFPYLCLRNQSINKHTMSTLLNRFTLLASFAFSAFCLQAVDKKPFGLMTVS